VVASLERESTSFVDVESRVRRAEETLLLGPGQVAALSGLPGSGMTRLGLSMIAPHATRGVLAVVDVRGWISPQVAWELGIEPEHIVVVRTSDITRWGRVAATLLDGVGGVYAEVPGGIKDAALRKLVAKARVRKTPMVLRPVTGEISGGIAHIQLSAQSVVWSGADAGHGHLTIRRVLLGASGRSTRGMEQTIEVEDDGTHDLRVVPHLGTHKTRHLA
jgi:hypothetical protein